MSCGCRNTHVRDDWSGWEIQHLMNQTPEGLARKARREAAEAAYWASPAGIKRAEETKGMTFSERYRYDTHDALMALYTEAEEKAGHDR